ncbi:MAG: hypothetical protein ABJA98_01520 [Acidobacteriota bacterium]
MDDDPLAQATQMIADARQAFAIDVDAILSELRRFSESLGDGIGEINRGEALRILRRLVLEKFDLRLPMRSLEAARLQQLVREAHDLLSNPETQVDLRDWLKSAEPFLRT